MRLAVATVALTVLAGCGAPAPPPTPLPTVAPTAQPTAAAPTPTPSGQSTADLAEAPGDVENAFLSDVDDLIGEATDLAVTPCDDLVMLTQQNPTLLPSIRGFAAIMRRASANQSALNT